MNPAEKTASLLPAVLFIVVGLTLTACGGDDEEPVNEADDGEPSTQYVEMGDDYGLTTEIQGSRSVERVWIEPEIEKIAALSEGEEYTLYNPQLAFRLSNSEHIYVLDPGNHTVKAFTPTGKYVATYGKGRGRAPGEIMVVTDMGVWRDSLVFLVDPRQRRVSFFEKNGDFVRTESFDTPVSKLAWTHDSTEYAGTPPQSRPT